MAFSLVILLSFWGAVASNVFDDLTLEADKPLERVAFSEEATVRCCYQWDRPHNFTWIVNIHNTNGIIRPVLENLLNKSDTGTNGATCHSLVFKSVRINDTGLYQCKLHSNSFHIYTHGTFLQVYKPLEKTLNLSERVKNSIITAEGVLLLMCVLIPGTAMLCKTKKLKELEKKKGREEENIYEGLNLDDCNSAYHQIQRTSQQGPYQDVANCTEDIQLEKP
ncbi:B-cell antigen receptor complex-associated protein alpha chain [Puntigrus tetrazona]|uniref:B-cell antigen receptor complex-associated protein alpha chain n=1 Tax=Puntigrus tetrazona TaxID=1606681 RepID=UPI001C8A5B25|nr:B-cell antigen receptor complex-associated protein alpha chain [Puntigrus tetrazona]